MQRIITTALLLLLFFPLFSQGTLSEDNKAKAHRKAKAEAKMFEKKGMDVVSSDQPLEAALISFYEYVFTEESANNRTYTWGMGADKSTSAKEAYAKALTDAKDNIPGLLATYYTMWIMAADGLTEQEKNTVQKAINDATPAFTSVILAKEPFHILHLQGEKNGNYNSQVRVIYNLDEIRALCRQEIKVYLKDETGWSDERMTKVLTFEH